MQWCEALGTEPYLCFNFGTGTLDEGMFFFTGTLTRTHADVGRS